MMVELGICDRHHLMNTYKNCFTGKEAVGWLCREGFALNIQEAIVLCQRLQSEGVSKDTNWLCILCVV